MRKWSNPYKSLFFPSCTAFATCTVWHRLWGLRDCYKLLLFLEQLLCCPDLCKRKDLISLGAPASRGDTASLGDSGVLPVGFCHFVRQSCSLIFQMQAKCFPHLGHTATDAFLESWVCCFLTPGSSRVRGCDYSCSTTIISCPYSWFSLSWQEQIWLSTAVAEAKGLWKSSWHPAASYVACA